ncbi:MAG: hypothetical protein ACM3OO_02760 [Planctomycetaceae bacterium]
MRSRLVVPVACVALALVAGSCASPGYTYVRNTDVRAAFKVPNGWQTFDKDAVLGLSGPQPNVPDPIRWLVGIEADPQGSPSDLLRAGSLTSSEPQGIALVTQLSFTERQSASLSYLRNFLFPVDQLIDNSSDARVLAYDDSIVKSGFRGVHLVFQFRAAELAQLSASSGSGSSSGSSSTSASSSALQSALLGGQGIAVLSPSFVQVDQTAYLDASTNRVYFMAVLCSATCYSQHQADIESTVSSWTVLP